VCGTSENMGMGIVDKGHEIPYAMITFPFSDLVSVSEPPTSTTDCHYPYYAHSFLFVIYIGLVEHGLSEDESSLIAFRRRLEGFKYVHVRIDLRLIFRLYGSPPGRPAKYIRAFHPPIVATNPDHICPKPERSPLVDIESDALKGRLDWSNRGSSTILATIPQRS
jgi:hypothetical protein